MQLQSLQHLVKALSLHVFNWARARAGPSLSLVFFWRPRLRLSLKTFKNFWLEDTNFFFF